MTILSFWERGTIVKEYRCQGTPDYKTIDVTGSIFDVPVNAPVCFVDGCADTCKFGMNSTSSSSLYYSIDKDFNLHVGTSKHDVWLNSKRTVKQCLSGVLYVYDGASIKEVKIPEWRLPPVKKRLTIKQTLKKVLL